VKVFIDECIDWRLTRSFGEIEVRTARQMGWSELKNGRLLREAAKQFDVFVTVDQSIDFQNNLAQIPIAVVILVARNNVRKTLVPLVPRVIEMLPELVAGTATRVEG
jgi:predicted nuclease of predicted toxin-antitoxin system